MLSLKQSVALDKRHARPSHATLRCRQLGALRRTTTQATPDESDASSSRTMSAPELKSDEEEQQQQLQQQQQQREEVDTSMPYLPLAGIAGLGVAETAYLTFVKLTGSTAACPISGCQTVLNSSYSELFGIPLSLLGLLAYGGMAATAFTASQQRSAGQPTFLHNMLLGTGAAAMVGVSGMLLYVLATQFAGEFCIWCYGSAGLSFTLLVLVLLGLPSRQLAAVAGPGVGAMAATVLALYMGFAATEPSTAGEDFELPYNAPIVTTSSSPQAVSLAKRLKEAGARMYGAFWCSHCFDQKQTFGKEAMASFPYEECYPDGWKRGTKVTDTCEAAGVRAFPTWIINGKVVEGELSLEELEAELAGAKSPPVTAEVATATR